MAEQDSPVFQNKRRFSEVFAEQVSSVGLGKALAWNAYVAVNEPLRRLSLWLDRRRDLRVCGVELVSGKFSERRDSNGATNAVSTPYGALAEILGHERFTPEDSFVDIGCGHGRVLAYLQDSGFPGKIAGIELDPEVAAFAQSWAKRYDRIEVVCGDALEQDLSRYNVFYLWKPMLADFFRKFVARLEESASRPVRMYYLTDFDTAGFLTGRPGWRELRRMRVYRHRGLPQFYSPQDCSVWEYDPSGARS